MSERPEDPTASAPRLARVRRTPKWAVFIATGLVLGVLAAVVVTATLARPEGRDGVDYGLGAVAGYLAVGLGVAGAVIGGLVAVVVGWRADRRR